MTTQEYVDGLRKMADLLEAHPEFGVPCSYVTVSIFPHAENEKEHAACAIRSLGGCEKIYDGDNFRLEKKVGVHSLWLWYHRRQICERVVVGKEIVPARPEQIIPAQPEHEREIVEWVCSPVLKKPAAEYAAMVPEINAVQTPRLAAEHEFF